MSVLAPEDLVLVAVVRRRKDFDIARVLGWYRIPVRSAPKIIHVDWLAFFLTGEFGEEKWSVRYVAPVRGHELVRRSDLLIEEHDHPDLHEPYFKLRLGQLRKLAHPIPAVRWRRFTFLYTTGERLISAREMKDLTLGSVDKNLIKESHGSDLSIR
jgi:hypothetical protein